MMWKIHSVEIILVFVVGVFSFMSRQQEDYSMVADVLFTVAP